MSAVTQQLLLGGGAPRVAFFDAITSVGVTAGLFFAIDVADVASYVGSGQTITDRSGSGNSWFRGTTSGSEASDPTFVGSGGSKSISTYFSYDGGDLNRLAVSNPAAINSIHKDSAKFTLMLGIRTPASFAAEGGLMGTHAGVSTNHGFIFYITSAGKCRFYLADGLGGNPLIVLADTVLSVSTNYMVALSIDEAAGAGGSYFWLDGGYNQVSASDTFNGTYTSPSSSAATYTAEIGAWGNAAFPAGSGFRLYFAGGWSGTIPSKANLDSIRTALIAAGGRWT